MNQTTAGNGPTKHDKVLFWGCFIALITTGFAFVSRMFLVNVWGAEFGLDEQQQGALLGIGIWPFAVSIVLFSLFIDKIGYKIAMVFSFVGYLIWSVIGVAAYFISDGGKGDTDTAYQMLYWGSFLLALCNGTVEAYINPVVATMFSREKTKWLNILHAGWPGGLVIAGLVTIAMGDVEWWLKIGIIAVPAVVFFVMLVPLRFPENERVAAGVSYREMLSEFGFGGAAVVSFLLTLQFIENIPAVPPFVFIALGVAMVVAFGLYTRSVGNPFVFCMILIMMPLATTEIGTDAWITGIMESVFEMTEEQVAEAGGMDNVLVLGGKAFSMHPGWVLVYTSIIMMGLRFCAGPIVHRISPVGLLIVSAILAILGLGFLSVTAGAVIFAAATLYAIGKTFFWPTMLGIVSEQSPKGGALTLNALAGIGMLAVGTLGTPFIGVLQAENAVDGVKNNKEIVEAVPAIIDEDGELAIKEGKTAYYGVLPYDTIVDDKIDVVLADLPEGEKAEVAEKIAETRSASKQGALLDMAIFPAIMLVAYIIMFFYFKAKGGYAAQHLTTDEGLSKEAEEMAAKAPQE